MPFYESIFIARQDLPAPQVEQMAELFAGIVTANGGEVAKKEFWGLRNLTYRIKKNRKGHYVYFTLNAPAAAVSELERNLRINEDILRYMTVRVAELETGPSAMMSRGRDERSDRWGDRGDRGERGGGWGGGGGDRGGWGGGERRGPRRDRDAEAGVEE